MAAFGTDAQSTIGRLSLVQHTKWWADKIEANRVRDETTKVALEAAGWTVVRVWEHEAPGLAAERIAEFIDAARSARVA